MEGTLARDAANLLPVSGRRLLLRPEEGAEALGLSRARIYELLASGALRSIKLGRSRRIPVAELEAFVARELAEQSA